AISASVRPGRSKYSACVARRLKNMLLLTETMNATQAKPLSPAAHRRKLLLRILMVVAVAAFVGLLMRGLTALMERGQGPAGFFRGMAQGALMPCALPNLIVGKDVTIYALNNTGLTYK